MTRARSDARAMRAVARRGCTDVPSPSLPYRPEPRNPKPNPSSPRAHRASESARATERHFEGAMCVSGSDVFFWLGALTSRAVSRRDQNAHRERQARRGATHAARARSGFATTLARLTHARASGAFGSPVEPRREAHRTAVRGSESGNRRSPTSPLSGDGGGDGAPDGRRRSARSDVHGRRRAEEGRGRTRDTTQQEGASPSPRSVPPGDAT